MCSGTCRKYVCRRRGHKSTSRTRNLEAYETRVSNRVFLFWDLCSSLRLFLVSVLLKIALLVYSVVSFQRVETINYHGPQRTRPKSMHKCTENLVYMLRKKN